MLYATDTLHGPCPLWVEVACFITKARSADVCGPGYCRELETRRTGIMGEQG